MSANRKGMARRLLTEVWGEGQLGPLWELAAPPITCHLPSYPEPVEGLEKYRQFLAAYYSLLGSVRFTVEHQREPQRVPVEAMRRPQLSGQVGSVPFLLLVPGGSSFMDFFKAGFPLAILTMFVVVLLVPLLFPL